MTNPRNISVGWENEEERMVRLRIVSATTDEDEFSSVMTAAALPFIRHAHKRS